MIIIGIAGGTGSGKTTFAEALQQTIARDSVIISQDSYYFAYSELSFEERVKLNYDHPSAFENELLIAHLKQLRQGMPIEVPVYDFNRYTRSDETTIVQPKPIIIVEGILLFADPALREVFDIRVFIDTDLDVCVLRRLMRDVNERGRTIESVSKQYLKTVKPMHETFVEPSKKHADIIVPRGGYNQVALRVVASLLQQHTSDGDDTK